MIMSKVVLITGASSDIGLATVKKFLNDDAFVIATYFKHDKELLELKNSNPKLELYHLNLGKEEEIDNIINDIILKHAKIDILINNAAFTLDTMFTQKTKANFMKTLEINLVGTFLISKKVGSYMLKEKQGKIINIASTNGIDTVYPESVDYDASKAGIINLTFNLAKEFSPYINVNALCPGWVDTSINKDLTDEFKTQEIDKILLKRFATCQEIANVIYFLASDEASYINGSIIRVDGGKA